MKYKIILFVLLINLTVSSIAIDSKTYNWDDRVHYYDNSSVAGKAGFIDTTGRLVIKAEFEATKGFAEGLAAVQIENKWGYIDKTGKMVIKPIYDDAKHFSNNKAEVLINAIKNSHGINTGGQWIMIDKSGNTIKSSDMDSTKRDIYGNKIPVKDYPMLRSGNIYYSAFYQEGLAVKPIGTNWKFIDKNGADLPNQNVTYEMATTYGYGSVARDYLYGYMDTAGNDVIPPRFNSARWFSGGIAAVSLNHKWGFIDKKGNFIIKPQFDGVGSFIDDICAVSINGKSGFIDKKGDYVIEPKFNGVGTFSEGLCAVNVNGKYGFIDKKGDIVIKPQFDAWNSFNEGLSAVKKNGKWGYIDKTGKIVIPFLYDETSRFSNGLASVWMGGPHKVVRIEPIVYE